MTRRSLAAAARASKSFALCLFAQMECDRLAIVSAGVAFYGLLAAFPALAALVALYGLLFDASQVGAQVSSLEGLLPSQALDVLLAELNSLVTTSRRALGWSAAGALGLSLWSAARGVKTLMEALNVAYDVREKRGFLRRNLLALALTLGAIVGATVAIAVVVLLPVAVRFVGLEPAVQEVIGYARWPVIALALGVGIAIMYRYGASREPPSWRVVSRGALIATGLWLAGSAGFSLYVSRFPTFSQSYGSVTAFVILLLWFLISAYAILLGAEVNGEIERRRKEGRASSRSSEAPRES